MKISTAEQRFAVKVSDTTMSNKHSMLTTKNQTSNFISLKSL